MSSKFFKGGLGLNRSDETLPPPYSESEPPPPGFEERDIQNITTVFSDLKLSPQPGDPKASVSLVHLKLLYAFQTLKEEIGYTDGLWGLWDANFTGGAATVQTREKDGSFAEGSKDASIDHEERQVALSRVREKRWALYIARAADRYEAWWKSMSDGPTLNEADIETKNSLSFSNFVDAGDGKPIVTQDQLPPIGTYAPPEERHSCK